jgi:flavin reductase (DIM6/NTAB) family NADH-FMN oxidoreductase RutF
VDDGALCLGAVPESDGGEGGVPAGVDLQAGESLTIGVRSGCLSNFCATGRSSKCSLRREGNVFHVTSELTWIGPEDLGTRCPSDCTFLESQCKTEALPAGNYQVVLGARTTNVVVPSHLPVRCDRDTPKGPAIAAAAPTPTPTAVIATPPASADPAAMPAAPGTGVVAEPPPGDTICIGPGVANKARALKTGQPLAITVLHKNPCLGASCTLAKPKCTVKRKGFELTLNAQFPTATTKPTQPCTEDCTAMAATCRTDGLPAGTYTLTMGAQKKTVQIPASSAPPCGN